MAEITGPISSLPGRSHAVPAGATCDEHEGVPATHRVQGETDSFGCEMIDLCAVCYAEHAVAREKAGGEACIGSCEGCSKSNVGVSATRDPDEGSCGPVYYRCYECRVKAREAYNREYEEHDPYNGDGCDLDV